MKPSRKHIRWRFWDYGADGGYFVTICTKNRVPYFGCIRPDLPDIPAVGTGHALSLPENDGHALPLPENDGNALSLPENDGNALSLQDISTYLIPTAAAHIAFQCWQDIPTHYPFVRIDEVVIMPNHLHGVLFFDKPDKTDWQPNRFGPQKDNLAVVMGSFKAAVSRQVRKRGDGFGWQVRYNDRVLRNETEYQIRLRYMWNNPYHWEDDDLYPSS
jgi:REP element-mobilizing transposase RayT